MVPAAKPCGFHYAAVRCGPADVAELLGKLQQTNLGFDDLLFLGHFGALIKTPRPMVPPPSVKRSRGRKRLKPIASRSQTACMRNMPAAGASTRPRLRRGASKLWKKRRGAVPIKTGLMRKTSSRSRPFCAVSRAERGNNPNLN